MAHPATGRWFNPPSQWFAHDLTICFGIATIGSFFIIFPYIVTQSSFSPYISKNYYPRMPYTKEFIEKYDRLNRWRHY